MIITYASDLHLEFGTNKVQEELEKVDADILILAGDIDIIKSYRSMTKEKSPLGKDLFNLLSYANKNFEKTFLVAGNHEHYGGEYRSTLKYIKKSLEIFNNVHFLENDYLLYKNVVFFGATMWTEMSRTPIIRNKIQFSMNDFKKIKFLEGGTYRKFTTSHASNLHFESLMHLDRALRKYKDNKFILIQHHAPFFDSIPEHFHNSDLNNAYYSQEMSERFEEKWFIRNPDYIIHGHIHGANVYEKHGISVLSNTRGYQGYESSADNFKFEIFSV